MVKRKCEMKFDLTEAQLKKMSTEEKINILKGARSFEGGSGSWKPLEAALFRLVVTKYGCGNWEFASFFLPNHNTAQFNTFCQKLFGQQSLAIFSGVCMDPYTAFLENCTTERLRKNGVIVHEGPPMSSEAKKKLKNYNKSRETLRTYDLPIVENRSMNYSKLFRQMAYTKNQIDIEIRRRGLEPKVDFHKEENFTFEEFLEPLTPFGRICDWNYDTELLSKKGQDNLWPLVRMAEDPKWFALDQLFHWNFVSGRNILEYIQDGTIKMDEETVEVFIPRQDAFDISPVSMVVDESEEEKSENLDEIIMDEVSVEELSLKEESEPEPIIRETIDWTKQKALHTWNCKLLCSWFKMKNAPERLITKMEKLKVDGSQALNLTLKKLSELGVESNDAFWSQTLLEAIATYGYKESAI